MADESEDSKKTSRKWIVTVWAMVVGTLIVLFEGFCELSDSRSPEGFGGLAMLLFGTGVAYIGGNVWQKQIFHKSEAGGNE